MAAGFVVGEARGVDFVCYYAGLDCGADILILSARGEGGRYE